MPESRDVGTEVCSDTLTWAWEHWDRLTGVDNRLAYRYRVGQSKSRRYWRWRRRPNPDGSGSSTDARIMPGQPLQPGRS